MLKLSPEASLESLDRRQTLQLKDGPNFDRPLLGAGNASRDFDRFIEVGRIDQEKAAELLARLRERTVGHLASSFTDANAGRGRHRVQGGSAQILPPLVKFVRQLDGLRHA